MGRKVLRFHGHEINLQPNPIGRLNKECVQGKDLKEEKNCVYGNCLCKNAILSQDQSSEQWSKVERKDKIGKAAISIYVLIW